jgi:hypothetical protein
MISSASIDVVTQASPYDEERTQWSLGMDYLRGNTTMSMSYTSSVESGADDCRAWRYLGLRQYRALGETI